MFLLNERTDDYDIRAEGEEILQGIEAAGGGCLLFGAHFDGLAAEVIGLGQLDSMIIVAERLRRGHFIGLLADRHFEGKNLARHEFLGAPAAFPRGPFQVAMLLQRPVVMMLGVFRGGNRYDVFFEMLASPSENRKRDGEAWLEGTMARYVARLEYYCREAPFNWFNFYDFWA